MVDVRGGFSSKQNFDDRESMLTWIRKIATNFDFGVVIGRFDNCTARRNPFVTILYERGGKYHPLLKNFKINDTGTRKCESPFKIRCYMLASTKWRSFIVCGLHNHDLCIKLQGHPMACRLNPVENASIKDMSWNFVQPKNILATLKRKEPENISNIRQVYNQRYRNKKASRGDRSKMQQLLKMLDDKKYVVRYKNYDDEVMVQDIFWTHLDSINLFNTFSTVLLLDCTYKTKKYRLPLFEMVGVTSTEKTFAVGFAFLECEKKRIILGGHWRRVAHFNVYPPVSHWMRFPEMEHLITCAYDMVCIDLTRYGFLETFFPLRTAPATNPIDRVICVGWLANSRHFVQVYLKPGCPIPPTSPK